MATRIAISFKADIEDIKILEFLREESSLIGPTAYIKLLLQKEKIRKENEKRKWTENAYF